MMGSLIWWSICFVFVVSCWYQSFRAKCYGAACFEAGCLGFFLYHILIKALNIWGV